MLCTNLEQLFEHIDYELGRYISTPEQRREHFRRNGLEYIGDFCLMFCGDSCQKRLYDIILQEHFKEVNESDK